MPKHKKGLTEKQKEKWVEIANSILEDCKNNGGKQGECEKKAIRIANSKVGGKSNSGDDEMSKKTLKGPKGRFTFSTEEPLVELADNNNEGDPKKFSMEAYTGNKMPDMFDGWICVDVGGIEFGGKKRFPILESHNWDKKIGVANGKPSTEGNKVSFSEIKALSNDDAQNFLQNLEDGFPYQASISVRPRKIEEVPADSSAQVNGMNLKGPGIILRSSKFKEASVCVFGRDENTSVASMSSEGEEEEFEVEVVNFSESEEDDTTSVESTEDDPPDNSKNNNSDGGSPMDFSEIKQQYPELYKMFQDELDKKDAEISSRDTQIKELSQSKENMTERLNALEKAEAIRHEQDLKAQSTRIIDAQLKDSTVPEYLHGKVHAQFSYKDYVDQDGNLDTESFKEAVQAEVKDWDEKFSKLDSDTVQGAGGSGTGTGDGSEEFTDYDAIANRMAGHVVSTESE